MDDVAGPSVRKSSRRSRRGWASPRSSIRVFSSGTRRSVDIPHTLCKLSLQTVVAGYRMERQAGSAVPPSRLDRADARARRYVQPIGLQTRHLEALVAI